MKRAIIAIIIAGAAFVIVDEIGRQLETFEDPHGYRSEQFDDVTDIETVRREGTVEAQGSGRE